ncbi:MAG: ParB N-terminal domain-containing protein, partial [Minisyncoccota bacterium]
ARALTQKEGSPLYTKISILGVDKRPSETITQATFVEQVLKYVSGNNIRAMKDRDAYKRGKLPERASGAEAQRLIFRDMHLDNKDHEIAEILWNYFAAVAERWPVAWPVPQVDRVLNKSTGFVALMRFFKDAYLHLSSRGVNRVVKKEEFAALFQRVTIDDAAFTKTNYIPGGIGQSKLYNELREQTGIGQ